MDDLFKNYDSHEGMGAAAYAVIIMIAAFCAVIGVVLTLIFK